MNRKTEKKNEYKAKVTPLWYINIPLFSQFFFLFSLRTFSFVSGFSLNFKWACKNHDIPLFFSLLYYAMPPLCFCEPLGKQNLVFFFYSSVKINSLWQFSLTLNSVQRYIYILNCFRLHCGQKIDYCTRIYYNFFLLGKNAVDEEIIIENYITPWFQHWIFQEVPIIFFLIFLIFYSGVD